jgi:hypothetical protein
MRHVANNASFLQRFVFEDKGAFLSRVALEADVILGKNIGAPCNDGVPFVGLVTVNATDFACQDGMTVRKMELTPFVKMALKTGFRRLARIDNGATFSARFRVKTARSMARFASHFLRILSIGLQARVGG